MSDYITNGTVLTNRLPNNGTRYLWRRGWLHPTFDVLDINFLGLPHSVLQAFVREVEDIVLPVERVVNEIHAGLIHQGQHVNHVYIRPPLAALDGDIICPGYLQHFGQLPLAYAFGFPEVPQAEAYVVAVPF